MLVTERTNYKKNKEMLSLTKVIIITSNNYYKMDKVKKMNVYQIVHFLETCKEYDLVPQITREQRTTLAKHGISYNKLTKGGDAL